MNTLTKALLPIMAAFAFLAFSAPQAQARHYSHHHYYRGGRVVVYDNYPRYYARPAYGYYNGPAYYDGYGPSYGSTYSFAFGGRPYYGGGNYRSYHSYHHHR